MNENDFNELSKLLVDPLYDWGDSDDSEEGPKREEDVNKIYELLSKIKIIK